MFLNILYSQRNMDYPLYVKILTELLPWVFQYNHHHYTRWLSVHIHDLDNLPKRSLLIYDKFMKGEFVTQRSNRKFSLLPHDQVRKQLVFLKKNKVSSGGWWQVQRFQQ